MGKNGKIRKNILKQFQGFTDDEILCSLQKAISEYIKLIESRKCAREILVKHNVISYYSSNETIEKRYFGLLECARLRGLSVPSEWYTVEITDEDIISRLLEFAHNERMWIDKHNYLFDLVNTDFDDEAIVSSTEETTNLLPSDREQLRVTELYDEIISKEFGKDAKRKILEKQFSTITWK